MRVGSSRKFLAIALVALSPLLIGATTAHADFDARLLAAQNAERSEIGVQPLVWDARLAADARKWAD